jgi:hypothetical protein
MLCDMDRVVVETFWRKLQEIISCRTTQKRSPLWDNKNMQMIQFPSLEECKKAFREHMADPKWIFECDATERMEEVLFSRPGTAQSSDNKLLIEHAESERFKAFEAAIYKR